MKKIPLILKIKIILEDTLESRFSDLAISEKSWHDRIFEAIEKGTFAIVINPLIGNIEKMVIKRTFS